MNNKKYFLLNLNFVSVKEIESNKNITGSKQVFIYTK